MKNHSIHDLQETRESFEWREEWMGRWESRKEKVKESVYASSSRRGFLPGAEGISNV